MRGCVSPRALAVVVAFAAAGCASYTSPFVHKTEKELELMEAQDASAAADFYAGRYDEASRKLDLLVGEPTVSRPLYEFEKVSVLLQQGRRDEAHGLMMKIRGDLELLFDEKSEKEAVSLWHGENNKVFKGDPHERATLYAFLAMSFLEKGEWDDAERCAKNGLLADSANTKNERYNSDYALLQYLGYVACRRAGRDDDASDYAREMAASLSARGVSLGEESSASCLLQRAPLPNAFLVVWSGMPPSFMRGGAYEEKRYAVSGENPFTAVTVAVGDGAEAGVPTGLANINFQALTRGGREMDNVLKDKAAVKSGLSASGNILLVLSYGCFSCVNGNNAMADLVLGSVGGAFLLLGCTCHVVGACVNPKADIRSWKNLPGELLVIPLTIPEGASDAYATVRAYRLWDNLVCERVKLAAPGDGISTTHCSLMPFAGRSSLVSGFLSEAVDAATKAYATPSRKYVPEIVLGGSGKGGR